MPHRRLDRSTRINRTFREPSESRFAGRPPVNLRGVPRNRLSLHSDRCGIESAQGRHFYQRPRLRAALREFHVG